MRRRTVLLALAGGAAGLLVYRLTDTGEDTPEARVRRALDEAARAAGRRDLGGVLEHVSADFSGRGLDAAALKGLLFAELRRGTWQKVLLTGVEVGPAGPDLMDVEARAVLARGEGVLPDQAESWRLLLTFRREADDAWRVVAADWRPAR